MTTELQVAARPAGAIAPRHSLSDIQAMAEMVCKSQMFPGVNSPQAACTLMLLCQAEGLHPMDALKRYHIIEGRPAKRADAMQAEFQARGGRIKWLRFDDEEARAIFSHATLCPDGIEIAASYEEFKRTGIVNGKEGLKKNWRQNPGAMLRARLISRAVRMIDPGGIVGLYTPEEVVDFDRGDAGPEAIEAEARPVAPAPQNNSGHGRGQYASPEQVKEYKAARDGFIDAANAKWADRWQDGRTGEMPDGLKNVLNAWQVDGHLLKWAVEEERLDPGIVPEEAKSRQGAMYVAIVFARGGDDRRALGREMNRYLKQQWERAEEALYRKNPAMRPAEEESQEGEEADDFAAEQAALAEEDARANGLTEEG